MTRSRSGLGGALVRPAGLALAAGLALTLLGCEGHGEARISWSFTDGPVQGAADCSRRGVAKVVITFEDAGGSPVRTFELPCGPGHSGERTVPEGTYQVRVQAFGPSGLPFRDPETGELTLVEIIPDFVVKDRDKVSEGAVVFTPNPPCADGVDNDHDGLVDADDPGCLDKNGDYDPSPLRTEDDDVGPGTLAVSWTVNGGRDTCAEVQPAGAATVAVLVDGLESGLYSCADGSGSLGLATGDRSVSLRLLDAEGTPLAETPTQDASIVQDVTTTLAFDVGLADFDPPQTGELRLTLSWGDVDGGCGDASPIVATQALLLVDAANEVVDATTLAGDPVDGTPGQCLDPTVTQGLDAYLPAGEYTLSITGAAPNGGQCWTLADLPLRVDIGPNPVLGLVVHQTDATGLCAP